MSKKKRDAGKDPTQVYNPYFGKTEDESKMAKKPLLTWILIVPGGILGAFWGNIAQNLVLGIVFGGIMGLALGSIIDKWLEKRRDK